MVSVAVFSPAKINLVLAVVGRRADGFHDLVSLVAPVEYGDDLWVRRKGRRGGVSLVCGYPAVPPGADNLVVRAADAFRAEAGIDEALEIRLTKRIPMGAGLGGGSSNAAATLRACEALYGGALDASALERMAAQLGSDCPLFLRNEPCLMRGRGERIERLSAEVRARVAGRRLLLFKPDFGISTPWAYGQLVALGGAGYAAVEEAEARVAAWQRGTASLEATVSNSFERVAFRKFLALPEILDRVRTARGVTSVAMTGSGSACFALLDDSADAAAIAGIVRAGWGDATWVVETRITATVS